MGNDPALDEINRRIQPPMTPSWVMFLLGFALGLWAASLV